MPAHCRTVPGFKPAHDLWRAGETGPRVVARRLAAQPSSHPARPARARRGARAPPVVTARWPRARQWAGAAGSVQPGGKRGRCRARRNRRGRTEAVAQRRGGEVGSRRRRSDGGRIRWSSVAWGVVLRQGAVAREAVGGVSGRKGLGGSGTKKSSADGRW
jgi:hypothetical protein